MAAEATLKPTTTLTLTEEERSELARLLESTLSDVRVELHHTHTPDFREQVQHRYSVLLGIAEKVEGPRA